MNYFLYILPFLLSIPMMGQVILRSDGPGNTYELINNTFAPNGGNVVEAPGVTGTTCDNHSSYAGTFGNRHIDEVFDAELSKYVFKFILHLDTDIDRDKCNVTDRQRNEIKTYNQSPDHLLGTLGETVLYSWKFKIDADFQPSGSFTHFHQLKAVGGPQEGTPLITLTARKANPDRLELRYAEQASQTTITTIPLSELKGNWIDASEVITYGEKANARYSLTLKNHLTQKEILHYTKQGMRMWKTDAVFIRPKWGIYRSLNHPQDLRDESVLFTDFIIEENPILSVSDTPHIPHGVFLYPNPSTGTLYIDTNSNISEHNVDLYDLKGNYVLKSFSITKNTSLDLSMHPSGIYYLKIRDNQNRTSLIQTIILNN